MPPVNRNVMLLLAQIRDNKEQIVQGLHKRNFENPEMAVEKLLETDDLRKSTQGELDRLLAESNAAAKMIGQLMKEGKREEAEKAKGKQESGGA